MLGLQGETGSEKSACRIFSPALMIKSRQRWPGLPPGLAGAH
ncbi:hypothetical protein C4K02_2225 [Pseudomonas synxantha]|nr:hypothetical protein C4K02_2225 [Pseudomonas synxantha]